MDNKLEEFGKIFVSDIRDNTIETFIRIFDGRLKGLTAKSVREKTVMFSDEQKEVVLWIISKVVDQCMHNTLAMIEEHEEIKVYYDMKNVAEMSDGLSGELYAEDGWIEKYSRQMYKED